MRAAFPLIVAGPIAYGLVVALAWLGGTRWLGAHPFWDVKVAVLAGLPALMVLAVAFMRPLAGLAGALLLAGLGLGAATWGKLAFAASYAENTFAGQCWFLGWIAGLGGTIALIALILRRIFAAMQRV